MSQTDSMEYAVAMNSVIYILISLICIGLSWWSLQQFRFDLFLKQPKGTPSKVLQILLSLALGSIVGRFLMDYFNWSSLLKDMFK